MKTYTGIVIALAAFDLLLLTGFYFYLRSQAQLDRRALFPVAAGLVGFVVHALLFFSGALLFVQLTSIAGIFGLYFVVSSKHGKQRS